MAFRDWRLTMLALMKPCNCVLDHARPLPAAPIAARERRAGLRAGRDVASDVDSPPHDKSIVDGYAVIAADVGQRRRRAGGARRSHRRRGAHARRSSAGTATRIMTGAPIAGGRRCRGDGRADRRSAGDRVRILQSPVKPGQNIVRRAASLPRGQTVLQPGQRLAGDRNRPAGRSGPRAASPPCRGRAWRCWPTGNELVPAGAGARPGQIRNSNGPMLPALAGAGRRGRDFRLGIARDDAADAAASTSAAGWRSDVLVLSGGVSAGVLDLVPQVLARLRRASRSFTRSTSSPASRCGLA